MQLTFECAQVLGPGYQPCAIHSQDNYAQIIFADTNGIIKAMDTPTPLGNFTARTFTTPYKICDDVAVEYLKLKHEASSIFVAWKNATEPNEVVPYVPNVVHTVRHRFAVWAIRQDLSKYLVDGSLEFSDDDPIARISMTFENPGYIMSHEYQTNLTPGTAIGLFFRAGDSERFKLGKYYIDKNDMSVNDATTSVDGRNTIGKMLKDQFFDSDNNYTKRNLQTLAADIFDKAFVLDYWVSTTTLERGMKFPPDMNLLDGFNELIQTNLSWKLKEDLNGRIGFGDKTDSRFGTPSTYEFVRNTDIFSRSVARDDQDAYARVCVHNETYSIAEYRTVDFRFVMGKKKTLHVNVARETTLADAQTYADELAALLASIGTIETFTGPFRPNLMPGDTAKIIGTTTKVLGVITSIRHKFGKSGYSTEFTVDSGGRAGKTKVSDYINKITGAQMGGQATRLY